MTIDGPWPAAYPRQSVVEWVRGTLLTDYQSRLSPALFDEFLRRYGQRLSALLSDERPFVYPFKRLLLWARQRSGGTDVP